MKVFLEHRNGDWFDDFVFICKDAFLARGVNPKDIIIFDGDNIQETLFDKYFVKKGDIMVGSVDCTTKFFEHLGVEVPKPNPYPKELEDYLEREIDEVKFDLLSEVDFPYFIKPADEFKTFTGGVMNKKFDLEWIKHQYKVDGDTNIWKSTPIEFISEYRCFVFEGKLMGIHHYLGDFREYPNVMIIEDMIKDFKSAPVAYTLDVGVTDDFMTSLVEVNDMWAIGSYGFNAKDYSLLVMRRMAEIQGLMKKN